MVKKEINKSERDWSMFAHLSGFLGFVVPFGNIIAPLLIMIIKGQDSPFIKEHARESLNFQITLIIYSIIAFILVMILIGMLLFIALLIFAIVNIIKATQASQKGESFRYPWTIRFVK